MRNLTYFEMCQVLQIIIFFATGGNSHSQFKYKAILSSKMTESRQIEKFHFPANDNSGEKEKKDEQPRPDKSFYENLPFEGLKSPPPKV